jgi:hypothetical protein
VIDRRTAMEQLLQTSRVHFTRAGRIVAPALVRNARWNMVVRAAIGALLIGAAALKSLQLISLWATPLDNALPRGPALGAASGEFLLGVWFVASRRSRAAWTAVLLVFIGFACYSVAGGIQGKLSCGCFGRIGVSPWLSLAVDCATIAALVVIRPMSTAAASQPARWWRPAIAAAVCALPLAVTAGWAAIGSLRSSIGAAEHKPLVLLEPDQWVGKPFPLLKSIDIGQNLSRGQWTLVLYHHDCSKCQLLVQQYESSENVQAAAGEKRQIALIELPPHAARTASGDTRCFHGQLRADKAWIVNTPVRLQLSDGIVTSESP